MEFDLFYCLLLLSFLALIAIVHCMCSNTSRSAPRPSRTWRELRKTRTHTSIMSTSHWQSSLRNTTISSREISWVMSSSAFQVHRIFLTLKPWNMFLHLMLCKFAVASLLSFLYVWQAVFMPRGFLVPSCFSMTCEEKVPSSKLWQTQGTQGSTWSESTVCVVVVVVML